ncbi:MalY/PatB family protein [Devosia aurantiaca]|uniref:cysteine-S-conjugate beta-lyase n=1 Tax=Devosia aurantiaca TaxID=2714858 RepID=A0A6M1SH92_9HYPH|nr:PatB family C-S lyase [Devosia aurantiaca]NGP18827.1 putative C-S lyase [Devosia aurantiaca]
MDYGFDTQIDRRNTGSNKWSKYASDVLPMWVADMDFAAAPPIVEAIAERLRHPVFGYCSAKPELREQIVADMKAKYNWTITPDDIVFLPGVEPGFNMAIKAFVPRGKTLVIQTPIYRPILMAPRHWDLSKVDLRVDQPVDEQASVLALADAVLLCNPHNPTGKVYSREDLLALAAATGDKPIIADEIHCELLYDGLRHIPIASLDPAIARRTATLMSAAKTYNIPGLKAGFAIVTDKAMREHFNASRLGMVDSVNILGLEASLAAFRDSTDWRDAVVAYLQANRDYLVEAVAERLPGVTLLAPEATYLAWLDCSALGLADPQAYFLEHARVAFSSGSDFGVQYAQFVRLNFGCTRQTLEEALNRLAGTPVFTKGR